jgi:hypothetical protein
MYTFTLILCNALTTPHASGLTQSKIAKAATRQLDTLSRTTVAPASSFSCMYALLPDLLQTRGKCLLAAVLHSASKRLFDLCVIQLHCENGQWLRDSLLPMIEELAFAFRDNELSHHSVARSLIT